MVATSRWNEYSVSATTNKTGVLIGKRAESVATGAGTVDKFTITSNNNLKVNINGEARTVALCSGVDLDPRFIALDIQRKVQAESVNVVGSSNFEFAQCEWLNGKFHLYSGGVTSSAAINIEAAASNDVRSTIGWSSPSESAGSNITNTYAGVATVTGTYTGQFDDVYTVIISKSDPIGSPSITGGSFSLGNGGIHAGGPWNQSSSDTYTVTVDCTNGSTLNAGTGTCPTFTVTSSPGGDNVASAVELLYSDYWYAVGTNGLRVKFDEGTFDGSTNGGVVTFTIACTGITEASTGQASSSVATAKYIVKSLRGDDTVATTTSNSPTAVGTKGLNIAFTNGTLAARDSFRIFARAIRPSSGDSGVTTLNFGNVTVSTDSAVKVVQFEIMSGAFIMNSLKFGLNSNGNFQHHDAGDNDTYIHYATVGDANVNDNLGAWYSGITASDISPVSEKIGGNTGAPVELWAAKRNLSEVTSADDSEELGNTGLVSDYIFTGIKLGASETSANTITYRIFYDFS